jgi:uncharacterized protein (PEP-CTERM system associated)
VAVAQGVGQGDTGAGPAQGIEPAQGAEPEPGQGLQPAEEAPPQPIGEAPNSLRGQSFAIQPSVEIDETFTDNELSTATNRKADAITTSTPRLFVTGEAPRLTGTFDYGPQFIAHAVDTTQNQINQNLFTSGKLTAVPDRFFLDANASMFDASRLGDRGFGNASQIPTNLDTHTYAYTVSPYAQFRLSDLGQGEVRYTAGQTIFSGNTGTIASTGGGALPSLSNETEQEGLVKLATDPELSRLQAEFDGSYSDLIEGLNSSRHTIGTLNGSYLITRAVVALFGGGYEKLTYPSQPTLDFSGPTWNVGGRYQPNPDQIVQLTYGEQEGQDSFTGNAHYRLTSATAVFATYSESNTTQQEQILQNLGSATETTPGNIISQSTGLPTSIANPNLSLQNGVTRTKLLTAGASVVSGPLDTYTLTLTRSQNEALSAGSVSQTSTGALLNWGHEINPDSSLNVFGGASTNSGSGAAGAGAPTSTSGTTVTFGASYNYTISQTLFASARYDLTHQTGSGTGAILVNLLTFSIRKTF